LSTQSALSLCQANSYNFCFLGVNSESEAKLSPKRRYRLVLGAQKELWKTDIPTFTINTIHIYRA
jgi:hypothetical protein